MSDDKKPFSDSRWNELGKPKIIGHIERTEEERAADKNRFREHLRKIGVLKDDSGNMSKTSQRPDQPVGGN